MNKIELLNEVRALALEGDLSREELIRAFEAGKAPQAAESSFSRNAGLSQVLYGVGAAVVFFGIAVLLWQNWKSFNDISKILSTLGSGVACYAAAVFIGREKKYESLSSAFYLISALVLPLGLQITFDIAGLDTGRAGVQSIVSGILLITFLLSFWVERKAIFILFSILYGTWFFMAFTNQMVMGNPLFNWRFSAYRMLALGLSYLSLAYSFRGDEERRSLCGFLNGFGVLGFLSAALALGGWKPDQNIVWEILFPGLLFGVFFLSIHLKSRAFLVFGALFLMGYIGKITGEYFAQSIGWPFALVVTGFGLIASGALYMNLSRKYFSDK